MARGPALSVGRGADAGRYYRRHVAVPVFRASDRAAGAATGRALVPHACAAGRVPRARHDPVRGIARAASRLMEGAHFAVSTPASLITFAHFSISALIKLPKYSEVPPISLAPRLASFSS